MADESSNSRRLTWSNQGGIALSNSEETEVLVDSLESQFQVVNNPTEPAVIEKVAEAQRAYIFTPSSQLKLTKPDKVQDVNRRLTLGKTSHPKYTD
jgi:archaellum component FlaG (FlaF/FlaG flagellin family)